MDYIDKATKRFRDAIGLDDTPVAINGVAAEGVVETTTGPVDVHHVLAGASHCKSVLVLGLDQNDQLYAASSVGQKGDLLFLMENFKHNLMAGSYDQ